MTVYKPRGLTRLTRRRLLATGVAAAGAGLVGGCAPATVSMTAVQSVGAFVRLIGGTLIANEIAGVVGRGIERLTADAPEVVRDLLRDQGFTDESESKVREVQGGGLVFGMIDPDTNNCCCAVMTAQDTMYVEGPHTVALLHLSRDLGDAEAKDSFVPTAIMVNDPVGWRRAGDLAFVSRRLEVDLSYTPDEEGDRGEIDGTVVAGTEQRSLKFDVALG